MIKTLIGILFLVNAAFCYTVEVPEKSVSGASCSICTVVLSAADNLLKQNKTEDEVVHFIEKDLCGSLGALNGTCVQYVEAYGRQILYELAQKIDPSIICSHLGLCSTIKSASLPKADTECEICQFVLKFADNFLQQNKTEDQIIRLIEKDVCGSLGALNGTCVQYVEAYGRQVLYELAQKIDPKTICGRLGLCKSEKMLIIPALSNSLNCTLCKVVIQQAQNMLENNATEAQVISLIEAKLCGSSDLCKNLIDTFGPTILKYIGNKVDPQKICELIGMCTKSKRSLVEEIQVRNPVYCTACQYAVQFIDYELKNNSTEQAIVNTLDKVCKIAPASTQKECDSIVKTYGVYLVQLAIEFADPLKVCQAIKLC